VLPNATVTLTEVTTNRVQTTNTTSDGAFLFRSLDPGTYKVRVQAAGFAAQEIPNINVGSGRVVTLPVKLEVGTTEQSVQVTDTATQIDTTTTLVAHNLSEGEFNRMPKGRSFESLVRSSANVSTGGVEGGIQINGASASENQFVIDGISTSSVLQGQQRQSASFEILQEVQVKTGGIEAQYGGATGGVITAVTKSGGNSFHGDLHYYFYGSPLNAGPPKRLLMDPNDLLTISYVQDYKGVNHNNEVGYSIGGRIIRDKLFFFSAASPDYQYREQPYFTTDKPTQRVVNHADATYMQAYNKLSFTPFRWLSGNVGWLYTPSHQEGILPGQTIYGNQVASNASAMIANQNRGWFAPQSSYTADLSFTLSSTAFLQLRGAYFWDNYKALGVLGQSAIEWGNASTGALPFDLPANLKQPQGFDTIPRVQTTLHDLASRALFQADFSKFIGSFGGSHDLRIGIGRMKNVNNVDISYPGGGYVTLWWDTSYKDAITGELKRGKYGFYQVDDIGTKGSTGGTIDNIYIQDRWRPTRRLSLDLGVRFEKEVVPSFRRDIRDYAFQFDWTQKIAPRLGASYDVFGDGRMKVFGSYNLVYNWIPYELSRGTFGGDVWHETFRSLDTLDVLSLGNGNTPGTNLFGAPYKDLRIPSFGSDVVDPGIKPMSDILMNAGVEYQVRPSVVAAVRYTGNHLRRAIEDIGTLDATGSEAYVYGNPGEGIVKTSLPYGGIQVPYPKPVRNYDGVEFSVSRRFANRWFGTASYTYSRLYGNYTGLTSTDEVTPPSTGRVSGVSQQSAGQSTRPGTSASRYYDLPYLVYDANGNAGLEGRLPTDRPHVIRLYGSYLFKFGTEIGAFYYGGSGTPMTTFVNTNDNAPISVNGRGDMGRTPFLSRTDMLIAHEIKKFGEGRALRLEFNAQNLFNQKISTFTYNYFNRYRTPASSGIDLLTSKIDFTKPYDYKALVAGTSDAKTKVYGALDPRYNYADFFTTGFAGRFGLKFIF
jgi:hypothetical protein